MAIMGELLQAFHPTPHFKLHIPAVWAKSRVHMLMSSGLKHETNIECTSVFILQLLEHSHPLNLKAKFSKEKSK